MASSAFKSTSKRSCDVVSSPSKPTRTAPVRKGRSRSVASRPRTRGHDDIQFSNKRDNPLFFSRHEDPAESSRPTSSCPGRPFRSLSRNPTPRSRNEETETDLESDSNLVTVNTAESVDRLKKTWSNAHHLCEPSDSLASVCSRVPNWDDGRTGIYFSEAEEQTINEFTQQILSVEDDDDVEASSTVYETDMAQVMTSICDIPNDLVNQGTKTTSATVNFLPGTGGPGPVELVLDIRREYVKELELSEERARKLRADLAAEEHHGLELGRALKELLPDSRVDSLQRSRLARKTSSERRRTSKRLTDEALAYFDECISISTFDSSDLSSLEDPPVNFKASAPEETKSVVRGSATVRATCSNNTASIFCQDPHGEDEVNSCLTAGNNSIVQDGPNSTFKSKSYDIRESWSRVQEDIVNYSTDKENEKHGVESRTVDRQVDLDEYNDLSKAESILFDKVLLKNRIDSGSVLRCEGVALSAYPSFIF